MTVIRSNDLPWTAAMNRGRFGGSRKALGGDRIACGLWELPPGKTSFPMHLHHVTEEALFVISGRAKVRTPTGDTEIGPGDYVSFLPATAGGEAHQLVNDGAETLVYLAISAPTGVDVVEYPDSGKVAAAVGKFPAAKRFMFRGKDQVDYWDGEGE